MKWTSQQEKVITTKDCNILVAAAAGSGKTAVLVQRIIEMLTDKEHPVPIERLLVVTFTNAAAAEMRERISRGIEEKLMEDPENEFLAKQKLYTLTAKISTIHSFCLDLIREHFEELDVDPSFRMGDETELKLLKADIAKDVMEVYYASGNEKFRKFVESYSAKNTDDGISNIILKVYERSTGCPWPEFWLDSCKKSYEVNALEMDDHPVIRFAMEEARRVLDKCQSLMESQENFCEEAEFMSFMLVDDIPSDRKIIEDLMLYDDFDALRNALSVIKWKKRSSLKDAKKLSSADEAVYKANLDHYVDNRDQIKKAIESLRESLFTASKEGIAKEMAYLKPSVEIITELVSAFALKYKEAKLDRNMLDFNDLEHYALELLVDFSVDEMGRMVINPTKLATELSKQFEEVICDEYQDSNLVQETILNAVSGIRQGRNNRFMVGDVKQSIYRFRMADAQIFMDKYNAYRADGISDGNTRIDLHQNFRSRAHVLEGINYIFERIMCEELGGITYDDAAALHPGAEFPEFDEGNISKDTEILILDHDMEIAENEEMEESKIELEARMVAKRIHELTDPLTGMDVYDNHTGTYHKAGYNDIVILMRSLKNWAEGFVKVFSLENIPSQAELSTGFLNTLEIRTLISFLQIIDNPDQDIPFAAVLRSPIAEMTSEELSFIHADHRDKNLYEASLYYEEDRPGYDKLQKFLAVFHELREASDYLEIYELLQKIYLVTGFYDYIQAMPSGERRKANLDELVNKAVSYRQGSFSGLFNFIRYIEQLQKNEVDFGEASIPSDTKGRVRIISAHKSKGLEYPIVFLAGTNKQFNEQDARAKVLVHRDFGIAMDAVDPVARKSYRSVYKRFISKQEVLETLAEEMRILYVAMTRAKEKLIITGTVNKIEDKILKWCQCAEKGSPKLPVYVLSEVSTYLDWIMPCLLQTDVFDHSLDLRNIAHPAHEGKANPLFKGRIVGIMELVQDETLRTMKRVWKKEELLKTDTADSLIARNLDEDRNWQYAWKNEHKLKGKYSVSELKKTSSEDEHTEDMFAGSERKEEILPSFMVTDDSQMEEEVFTGALRGTAYHRVFELLEFEKIPESGHTDWVKAQMRAMVASGKLQEKQFECVEPEDICCMLHSEHGIAMKKAAMNDLLYKEAQFVMGVPAHMVNPDTDSEELVVIQGIIDVWYEENGDIVLLDYKTDKVSAYDGEKILRDRYIRQLDYYQYALEHITGKKVIRRVIYSVTLQKSFEV